MIGITADGTGGPAQNTAQGEPALFIPRRYVCAVQRAGGAAMILPFTSSGEILDRYLDAVGGLLVSGGNFDISPHFYGQRPIPQLGTLIPERTEFELKLLRLALARDLPILGICGGAQAINVVLGGTLVQDIAAQWPGAGEHQQGSKKVSGGHLVEIAPGTQLRRIVRRKMLDVNTTHHQAVKRLGRNLKISATAEDGVIEAIESTRHAFVIGVQWHPEVLAPYQAAQRRLFSAFIAASIRHGRG